MPRFDYKRVNRVDFCVELPRSAKTAFERAGISVPPAYIRFEE
jgi:hypothetical protein